MIIRSIPYSPAFHVTGITKWDISSCNDQDENWVKKLLHININSLTPVGRGED
jgi:hypothetical protein